MMPSININIDGMELIQLWVKFKFRKRARTIGKLFNIGCGGEVGDNARVYTLGICKKQRDLSRGF
jgi:hypothetical protein